MKFFIFSVARNDEELYSELLSKLKNIKIEKGLYFEKERFVITINTLEELMFLIKKWGEDLIIESSTFTEYDKNLSEYKQVVNNEIPGIIRIYDDYIE